MKKCVWVAPKPELTIFTSSPPLVFMFYTGNTHMVTHAGTIVSVSPEQALTLCRSQLTVNFRVPCVFRIVLLSRRTASRESKERDLVSFPGLAFCPPVPLESFAPSKQAFLEASTVKFCAKLLRGRWCIWRRLRRWAAAILACQDSAISGCKKSFFCGMIATLWGSFFCRIWAELWPSFQAFSSLLKAELIGTYRC